MDFLELGKDIEFVGFNRDTTEYHFEILNHDAVSKFLSNAELIKFLTDPFISLSSDSNGCRTKFDTTSIPGELIISRQIKPSTFKHIAMRDLLMTLNTYVMPTAKEQCFPAWADMVSDFFLAEKSIVPVQSWPRGEKLLTNLSEAKSDTRLDI